jgi:hypothetical protein
LKYPGQRSLHVCSFIFNRANFLLYCLDPHCVLVYPRQVRPITPALRKLISKYLASLYGKTSQEIRPLIPSPLEHWGKIQWLEGGDMMHASEIGKHGTRDMTYVKVQFNFCDSLRPSQYAFSSTRTMASSDFYLS